MNRHHGSTVDRWLKAEERRDPSFAADVEAAAVRRRIAEVIYAARRSAGLTQPQLAKRIGSSQQAVSRVEAGAQNVTVELLERIARALGGRFEGRIVFGKRA